MEQALVGMVDVQRTPGAVQPWRLPFADVELYHPQLVVPAMCPSGVRLRLVTASRRLWLDAEPALPTSIPGTAPAPLFPSICELLLDGQSFATAELSQDGVGFDHLPGREKQVELWLPTLPGIRLRGLRALDGAALLPAPPDRRPRWLVHGSSITHGHGADPAQTWPAVAARLLGRSVTNLGYAGACLLDPLVARMIAELPIDHITLKIGINVHNTAGLRERTFAPVLHGFLATIRSRRPRVPIALLGPVFGGEREKSTVACRRAADGSGLDVEGDLTLEQIRGIAEGVVDVLRRRGDRALTWADGRDLFLDRRTQGRAGSATGCIRTRRTSG
ncbi:GDSL-type esterase/lipase family protein [Streptacidiphilus sp. PAMC 29251]